MATVMLMMLALRWLPAESPPLTSGRARRRAVRDAVLAVAVGVGISALAWVMLNQPVVSMADYFLQTSLPLGGGANAVNVIIVDYRGFDTLGEITVLVISALIIHALLAPVGASRQTLPPALGPESSGHPLMLQLASRAVLPFAVLIALHFLLRGHNQPGGGFIAGLLLAIALMLQNVAHGQSWVARRSTMDYRGWMGWGLLIAAATGAASWAFGAPFLTSTYDYPWLPGVGGVPLASAAAFDLGVFLVVVGATMVMLLGLGRLSEPTGLGGQR